MKPLNWFGKQWKWPGRSGGQATKRRCGHDRAGPQGSPGVPGAVCGLVRSGSKGETPQRFQAGRFHQPGGHDSGSGVAADRSSLCDRIRRKEPPGLGSSVSFYWVNSWFCLVGSDATGNNLHSGRADPQVPGNCPLGLSSPCRLWFKFFQVVALALCWSTRISNANTPNPYFAAGWPPAKI